MLMNTKQPATDFTQLSCQPYNILKYVSRKYKMHFKSYRDEHCILGEKN